MGRRRCGRCMGSSLGETLGRGDRRLQRLGLPRMSRAARMVRLGSVSAWFLAILARERRAAAEESARATSRRSRSISASALARSELGRVAAFIPYRVRINDAASREMI